MTATEYADQRAHDVTWMTAAERAALDVRRREAVSELSPEGRRDVAAMNAQTFAMSKEEREQWFRDHPVSDFEDQP